MESIEKTVAILRDKVYTKTELKKKPVATFGNFKRKEINKEIDRQFEIVNIRGKKRSTDPLIKNKRDRQEKVYFKYISYANFSGNYIDRDQGDMRFVSDYDPVNRMALIRVDSWINYSSRYGTYRKMAGLVLFDRDSQEYRFLRVSPQINTIKEAIEYIKPAAVKKAEDQGKSVIRQGDVYFIPSKKWDVEGLDNHVPLYENNKVIIKHPTHTPVILETPHKAVQQIVVKNTHFREGGGRIAGQAD